jgi:hypothetical protein
MPSRLAWASFRLSDDSLDTIRGVSSGSCNQGCLLFCLRQLERLTPETTSPRRILGGYVDACVLCQQLSPSMGGDNFLICHDPASRNIAKVDLRRKLASKEHPPISATLCWPSVRVLPCIYIDVSEEPSFPQGTSQYTGLSSFPVIQLNRQSLTASVGGVNRGTDSQNIANLRGCLRCLIPILPDRI